jgi:hypothetical protein
MQEENHVTVWREIAREARLNEATCPVSCDTLVRKAHASVRELHHQ